MANEARISSSLSIEKGNLDYASRPSSFTADVATAAPTGPSPGSVLVATAGTDIVLTQLTTPGYVVLKNYDSTNFVEYGIWDGANFHELGELQAGEVYVLRFSRNLSGFRLKANTAACDCSVEAVEA